MYTDSFTPLPLLVAAIGLAGVYTIRFLRAGRGPFYTTLAIVPNTEYARVAANSLRESISINGCLQARFEPLVAHMVLPLFALANAGVVPSSDILVVAAGSSVHGRSPWAW
ncbi:Na+/H+ antiporter NhaA [Nonomuraea phyllanthi]|uniref:Na+/H+ antiporter NhaA n=1 Tax=Nonomuraea phyllanthi TaxID=2219224 RepID=UPI001D0310E4|nr:Na+/H+ antiporter NhaA [Nonomuraea phyllanthi]